MELIYMYDSASNLATSSIRCLCWSWGWIMISHSLCWYHCMCWVGDELSTGSWRWCQEVASEEHDAFPMSGSKGLRSLTNV